MLIADLERHKSGMFRFEFETGSPDDELMSRPWRLMSAGPSVWQGLWIRIHLEDAEELLWDDLRLRDDRLFLGNMDFWVRIHTGSPAGSADNSTKRIDDNLSGVFA